MNNARLLNRFTLFLANVGPHAQHAAGVFASSPGSLKGNWKRLYIFEYVH